MPTDIRLPVLGEGADSGTVITVLVKEGDVIKKDDNLVELENEKAVASIPSSASGKVTSVHVKPGQKISVGQVLVTIESPETAQPAASAQAPRKIESPFLEKQVIQARQTLKPPGIPEAASPTVRKIAAELGIDLSRVSGSEAGGRITMEDLRKYIQTLQQISADKSKIRTEEKKKAPATDFAKWGPIQRRPMSSLRKTIADRMQDSAATIPHVTQFEEIEIDAAVELQRKLSEKQSVRLTFTPFILKALVRTLKKHPIFNSSLDELSDEIVLKDYFHIGIAVDTEQGLIVPVIRDADRKNIFELAQELSTLSQRTRERKISADELKGGTFTISNQGAIGGGFFTPIINKPEVSILGLGRSTWKPVVRETQICKHLVLPVALSYDHRVIDGAQAARFVLDLGQSFAQLIDDDFT